MSTRLMHQIKLEQLRATSKNNWFSVLQKSGIFSQTLDQFEDYMVQKFVNAFAYYKNPIDIHQFQ